MSSAEGLTPGSASPVPGHLLHLDYTPVETELPSSRTSLAIGRHCMIHSTRYLKWADIVAHTVKILEGLGSGCGATKICKSCPT